MTIIDVDGYDLKLEKENLRSSLEVCLDFGSASPFLACLCLQECVKLVYDAQRNTLPPLSQSSQSSLSDPGYDFGS